MIKKAFLVLTLFVSIVACKEQQPKTDTESEAEKVDIAAEKAAILQTLNSETAAAFNRDYEGWQDKWVHDANLSKVYLNFADSTFSESIGWEEVDQFVKDYFIAHPDPEPVPEALEDINVRLDGTGAFVVYNQYDSLRGRKRETRLMQKADGQWKIAGMQTTIYGVQE